MPILNPSNVQILTSDIADRRLDVVAGTVQPNESTPVDLALGISLIHGLEFDSKIRLRLYRSHVARVADLMRPINERPQPGRGLLLEVVSTDSLKSFDLSPVVWSPNPGGLFASITNLEAIATSPSFSLKFWEF